MSTPDSTVLLLGCGLVAPPLVKQLATAWQAAGASWKLLVATRSAAKVEAIRAQLSEASAQYVESLGDFDFNDAAAEAKLEDLCSSASRNVRVVISLLPFVHHPKAAKIAIRNSVHFLTASYVSDAMKALDEEARAAGVLVLNECGLDPGLDHCESARIVDAVHAAGGQVEEFYSITGGLPSCDANTNPLGYKLSWSPRGVLLASRNGAEWLQHGAKASVSFRELFAPSHVKTEAFPELGEGIELDWYLNRDSLSYKAVYGIEEAKTIQRGTYRFAGTWCPTIWTLHKLEWSSLDENAGLAGRSYASLFWELLQKASSPDAGSDPIAAALEEHLGLPSEPASRVSAAFGFLGLASEELTVPEGVTTPLDAVCARMEATMQYTAGERDMIVMRHRFEVAYSDVDRRTQLSTLIDYGHQDQSPPGDSSMARTVTLPLAAAVLQVVQPLVDTGATDTALQGVVRPVTAALYTPILQEMQRFGVAFDEAALAPVLWLRDEVKPHEFRTALAPEDAQALVARGVRLVVERSTVRCFKDDEYESIGAKMVASGSWVQDAPSSAVILGLKELPDSPHELTRRHVFFAHCFKQQDGWKKTMRRFTGSNGFVWDLEFLRDAQGRRIAAFGEAAGRAGAGVGLLIWARQQLQANRAAASADPVGELEALTSWESTDAMVESVRAALSASGTERTPRVIVIGALGRCGRGAVLVAKACGAQVTEWDLPETSKGGPFPEILDHDVLINCVYLNPDTAPKPFITMDMLRDAARVPQADSGASLSVLADVSCDFNNPANPVPVYAQATTISRPSLRVLDARTDGSGVPAFDVTSIDHLPTLLPREATSGFSALLRPHLENLLTAGPPSHAVGATTAGQGINDPVWKSAEQAFRDTAARL